MAKSGARTMIRPTHLDETGVELVDAAQRLLADSGASSLTVRRISAEAGVSTMCLYDRFGDKNGVVEHLYVDGFRDLEATLVRAIRKGSGALNKLVTGCVAYRRWALAHRDRYTLMFTRSVPDFQPTLAALVVAGRALAVLEGGLTAAIAEGLIIDEDPHDLAHIVWGVCHGMVILELDEIHLEGNPARRYQRAIEAILAGLSA